MNRKKKALFLPGTELECMVTGFNNIGIFVSMGDSEDGFILNQHLYPYTSEDFEITDIIHAQVIKYNDFHRRFNLKLTEKITT